MNIFEPITRETVLLRLKAQAIESMGCAPTGVTLAILEAAAEPLAVVLEAERVRRVAEIDAFLHLCDAEVISKCPEALS